MLEFQLFVCYNKKVYSLFVCLGRQMEVFVKIVGLTGGSGSGKGMVCRLFRTLGCSVIDTDELYHDMISSDSDCSRALIERFGPDISDADGAIIRPVLADIVFGDSQALSDLNRIAHSFVRDACESLIKKEREKGTDILIIDAPQLFEAGMDSICDHTVAVVCDRQSRIKRICDRDGITSIKATARMVAQHTDAFFCENCDYIIDNNSDIARLLCRVRVVLDTIKD